MNNQRIATYIVMMGALMFTLSSIPGLEFAEGSVSLSSSSGVSGCDIEGQIKADGEAECDAKVGAIKGKVLVTKVSDTEGGYTISGDWSIGCEQGCPEGIKNLQLTDIATDLSDIKTMIGEQADAAKLQDKIDKCLVDDAGDKLSNADALECHIDKMSLLDDEKAVRKYYDKYIREKLKSLATSGNASDARVAADLAQQIADNNDFNCQDFAREQHNMSLQMQAFTSQQAFNPYASAASSDEVEKSTPADYIKESTCDIVAVSNYSSRMATLNLALSSNNEQVRMAAAGQIQSLSQNWGAYFEMRGFNLNSSLPGFMNIDAGILQTQNELFKNALDTNYQSIIERHKELINGQIPVEQQGGGLSQPNQPGIVNPTDPRMGRGGSVSTAVEPWSGNAPVGNSTQGGAPGVIAPKLDTPVGG